MERLLDTADRKPRRSTAATALRVAGATVGVGVLALALVMLELAARTELGLDAAFSALERGARTASKQQRLHVDSLGQLQKTVFFDAATHEPKVWYAISAGGEVHLFSAPGRHPDSGEPLKPVTTALVQQLERRFRAQEQERVADAERRAATARADAEIARARRAQASAAQGTEGEASVAMASSSTPRGAAAPASPDSPALPQRSAGRAADAARAGGSTRADDTDDAYYGLSQDARRATQYNELVATARVLIDSGRYKEAQAKAQRAIFVDPRRLAARTLWAEAQTRLDESPAAFAGPQTRWPY